MDFVHDQLVTGRAFPVLTVIDQWSRESVLMEANAALTGRSVVEALEALSAHRSLPKAITVDHGTEFTSKALDEWAYRRGVQLDFIRPGKPVENAFIESFNGRLRNECLNVYSFESCAMPSAARRVAQLLWAGPPDPLGWIMEHYVAEWSMAHA
jgi:putative transposase